MPIEKPSISVLELVGPLLSVTGFGFAVAITVVAVVLSLPLSRMTALLVMNVADSPLVQIIDTPAHGPVVARPISDAQLDAIERTSSHRTGYLDLTFTFAWTAICNIFASAVTLIWAIAFGNQPILTSTSTIANISSSIVATMVTYAMLQMLSSLNAAYNFARVANNSYRSQVVDSTRKHREQQGDRRGIGRFIELFWS
ncbi:hypothetical protein [Oerskovia enterophila]|uniref:hypothetical protein n=1 Tax=Oerskovia enterophila TaxID=43678 RepID=UPI003392848A